MLARLRSLFVALAVALVLLQPNAADAKIRIDVREIVSKLVARQRGDVAQLVRFFAENPDKLKCLNHLVPFPTNTIPAMGAMAVARGLRYSKIAEDEETCVRYLNPATVVVDRLVDGGLEKGLSQVKNKTVRSLLSKLAGDLGKEAEAELCRQIEKAVDAGAKNGFKTATGVLGELGVQRTNLPEVLQKPFGQLKKEARRSYDKALRKFKLSLCEKAKSSAKNFTELLSRYSVGNQIKEQLKAHINRLIADTLGNVKGLDLLVVGYSCGCPLAYRTNLSIDRFAEKLVRNISEGINCLRRGKVGCFVEKVGFDTVFKIAPELACNVGTFRAVKAVCNRIVKDTAFAVVDDLGELFKKPTLRNAAEFTYSLSGLRLTVNIGKSIADNERVKTISEGIRDRWMRLRHKCPYRKKPLSELFVPLWQDGLDPCNEIDTDLSTVTVDWSRSHFGSCVDAVDKKGCYKRGDAHSKCKHMQTRFLTECRADYAPVFVAHMRDEITNQFISKCRDDSCRQYCASKRDGYLRAAADAIKAGKLDDPERALELFSDEYEPHLKVSIERSNRRWNSERWAAELEDVIDEYKAKCRDRTCWEAVHERYKAFRKRGVTAIRDGKPAADIDRRYTTVVEPSLVKAVVASIKRDATEEAQDWAKAHDASVKGKKALCRDRQCRQEIDKHYKPFRKSALAQLKAGKSGPRINEKYEKSLKPKFEKSVDASRLRAREEAASWAKKFDQIADGYEKRCKDKECWKSVHDRRSDFRKHGVKWLTEGKSRKALDDKYESSIKPAFERYVAHSSAQSSKDQKAK